VYRNVRADGRNIRIKPGEPEEVRALRAEISAQSMHFNWFGPLTFEVMLSVLRTQLGDRPARLLDVGCGNGEFLRQFLAENPSRTAAGIDAVPMHLENSRNRLAPFGDRAVLKEDILENIDSWPQLGPFDAITVANVFHFINEEDLDPAMAGLFACLKPGGVLLTTQHTERSPQLKEIYKAGERHFHERFQPTGELKTEIEKLRAKVDQFRKAGVPVGLDTNNVLHSIESLRTSMTSAGFTSVDVLFKLFGSAMLIGIRP
jgi:SAM-dependent methyltransferase